MTAPAVPKPRTVASVDRDIDGFRRDRGRALVQIDEYLRAITALRAKYARAGVRIDELLEERTALTVLPD
jgi:hypothetical protein